MAHSGIGHIGDFHPDSEDWICYTERLQLYFVANGITDATKQQAIPLSVCGSSTYQLIRDLLSPSKPTDKSFDDLVALVKEHQQPAPSFIAQRCTFNSRLQQPGVSISTFIAQLRIIAQHCKFGTVLDDMLRDRLVCGCRDKRLQYKLLSDPELTFDKVLLAAKSSETADRGAKDLLVSGSVNKLNPHRRPQQPPLNSTKPTPPDTCSRCGAAHSPSTCKYKTATCHYCKKLGHLASVCRKKARDLKSDTRGGGKPRNHKLATEDNSDEPEDPVYSLYHTTAGRPRPTEVSVTLNMAETVMEVDTGATLSVMSDGTYNRLWVPDARPPLLPSRIQLSTHTGEKIHALGTIMVNVCYQNLQHQLSLLIVPGTGPSLLGRDWLQHIHIDWTRIHQLNTNPKTTC